jgi:aminoglycoside phosphotransferase (APT) family kinase protein
MGITKVGLSPDALARIVRHALGSNTRIAATHMPGNGMYNAAYLLDLEGSGPRRAFLKVAPPDAIVPLTYERGLMQAEIAVLEAAAPLAHVPKVLAADLTRRHIDRDYLFMEALDGEPLSNLRETLTQAGLVRLRGEIGRIAGTVGSITGTRFGYPGNPDLQANTWPQAFRNIVAAIFADARRFDVALPLPIAELEEQFDRAMTTLLIDIDTPRLVHYDLWDGNVLVRRNHDGWNVSGIIDWERAFYGDPLAEIVSLVFFRDDEQFAVLMQGFAATSGIGPKLDETLTRRLALYKAYLWMIMIVEAKPRGTGGSILLPSSGAARRLLRDLATANSHGA